MRTTFCNNIHVFIIILLFLFFSCGENEGKNNGCLRDSIVDPVLYHYINNYIIKYKEKSQLIVFQLFCIKNTYCEKQFFLTSQVDKRCVKMHKPTGYVVINGEYVFLYSGFESVMDAECEVDTSFLANKRLLFDEKSMDELSNDLWLSEYNFTHPGWIITYNGKTKKWSHEPGCDTIIFGREFSIFKNILRAKPIN